MTKFKTKEDQHPYQRGFVINPDRGSAPARVLVDTSESAQRRKRALDLFERQQERKRLMEDLNDDY